MYSQQLGDPQRIEIKPAPWRMYGIIAALVIFTVVGLLIAVLSESLVDRCMGIAAVAFFGGGGALWLRKLQRKEHFRVAVSPGGLDIYFVGAGASAGWHTIPWKDIEEFGITKHGSAEFTTVKLKSYESLLASISPEQAEAVMRMLPAMQIAVHSTAGLAAAIGDFEEADELVGMGRDMSQIKNLEGTLKLSRDTYGGEFLLPWSARDRSAQAFAKFLDNYRHNHM